MEVKVTGICGKSKKSDVVVSVVLEGDGIDIEIKSKNKPLFGKQMEKAVKDTCEMLKIENAKITLEDYGALDFVIRARTRTAIKMAKRQVVS